MLQWDLEGIYVDHHTDGVCRVRYSDNDHFAKFLFQT